MRALLKEARGDSSILLLVGDLGFGVVEDFATNLPRQFFNFGINEQSLVSAAAGLAYGGFKPYVYSIGNFPTFRALEQVRNDICYMNLDVTIISIGAGFAYGTAGYSHHLIEDISALSQLPNLRIYSPADPSDVLNCFESMKGHVGPKYLRLGKGSEQNVLTDFEKVDDNVYYITGSEDITILCTGQILDQAVIAKNKLALVGRDPSIIHFSEIDLTKIRNTVINLGVKNILTLEEHVLRGGFGSLTLEALNQTNISVQRLGIDKVNSSFSGSRQHLLKLYGLDSNSVVEKYLSLFHF